MEETKLILKKRTQQGSSNARRLRRTGSLPGIVYGEGKEALSVEMDAHAFELILQHHTSETMLLEVVLDKKDTRMLVKDVQHHPVNSELLHVDFQEVDSKKVLRVNLMIQLVGESAGVKAGGVLEQVLHEIVVECLPDDLMETLEVDISALEIGDALHVSDIDLGGKFKVQSDETSIIATVAEPRAEQEEDAEDEVASEEDGEDAAEKSSDDAAE
jgi:large subunit ribosomal protein L25